MVRLRLLLVVAMPLASRLTFAQLPPGYYDVAPTQLPDSLREVTLGGRFAISVVRVASNADERRLIERAESILPLKDSIERAARLLTGSGHAAGEREAAALPGQRWWWRDWDGVLLPFALTGATAAHYIERVRALSTQPNPFASFNPGVEHRASVDYSARVVRPMDRPGSVEVHLQLKYGFHCGSRCAIYFTHSRVVEFDSNGQVTRIRGDAPPRYTVS